MENIITAFITGLCSVVAVIITNKTSNDKIAQQLNISQAVTDEKIVELTREVREHNDFARRIPVIEEKIKVANKRIEDLEVYHK